MKKFAIAIHGGAGTILRSAMDAQKEKLYQSALREALHIGTDILRSNGSALDAVEQTVKNLEDCELFNAGRGSVFTSDEQHEMDASIMDGQGLKAGAVSLIKTVKNPVQLARLVMEKTDHVFLAGEGAERFAREMQMESMPKDYFYTEQRYQQLLLARSSERVILDHADELKDKKYGTVGAVALDLQGHLAAATSTGGMTNKRYGRVGDTPMIGAGTYANDAGCAISCTGSGEYFIRMNVAFHVYALMVYGRLSLEEASRKVVMDLLPSIEGDGGLIGVDRSGNISLCFNTEGMYRASYHSDHGEFVGIYRE